MRQIFIDKFIVPANAEQEFTTQMNFNRNFIRSLTEFIKDEAYKRTDAIGNLIFITVATWESEEALANARGVVQAEYQQAGFNPMEMLARLNITMEREICQPVQI